MCAAPDCGDKAHSKGYCQSHYQRVRKGLPIDQALRKLAPKGSGTYTDGYHYIVAKNHPNAMGRSGVIGAHRLIMAEMLGRPLLPGETVHHKNGNRSDNRLHKGHELHCPNGLSCCNLELWASSQVPGQRVRDLISWAETLLQVYAPEKLV